MLTQVRFNIAPVYRIPSPPKEDRPLFVDLTQRHLIGELMDAPDLSPQIHRQALKGLRRINVFSRTAAVVSRAIELNRLAAHEGPIRVLDLACGGGDITAAIAADLYRKGIKAEVVGWDRSETAIEFARNQHLGQQSSQPNPSRLSFEIADAFEGLHAANFDIIYCTLFLHHLTDDESQQLLQAMYRSATQLVLIDDLRRTQIGYTLAVLGCRLLSRSPIVHVDGPLSVRAAFNESELIAMSERCSLPRPSIARHWPSRFLATWKVQR